MFSAVSWLILFLCTFMRFWLQAKSPVASHISSQPRSSDNRFLLSVSCFITWQYTSSRRISCRIEQKTMKHMYFFTSVSPVSSEILKIVAYFLLFFYRPPNGTLLYSITVLCDLPPLRPHWKKALGQDSNPGRAIYMETLEHHISF